MNIFLFLENTSVTKSECIAHCKNFWLASLPSVFDFDRIKYEFVTKVNVQNRLSDTYVFPI